MLRRFAFVLLSGGVVLVNWGCGAGDAEKVAVRSAWVRALPPGQSATAAYMIIENPTAHRIVLRAAESAIAETIEIHEMASDNGMMRMRMRESLEIPASSRLELAPGGLHLMLIGLRQLPGEGGEVPILLRFESAGPEFSTARVQAIVAGPAGPAQP